MKSLRAPLAVVVPSTPCVRYHHKAAEHESTRMRGISSPELKEIVMSRAPTRQSQASRDNMNLVEVAMECYLNLSVGFPEE